MRQLIRNTGPDFRLAGRALRAAPAVTFVAVLTLALGIGATTAVFSVVNGLMLRPLPVKEPQRLVTVTSDTALRFGFQAGAGWSYAMWDQLRQRADAFDGAFADARSSGSGRGMGRSVTRRACRSGNGAARVVILHLRACGTIALCGPPSGLGHDRADGMRETSHIDRIPP